MVGMDWGGMATLLAAVLSGVAAVIAALAGWRNGIKVDRVEKAVDGRLDELVAAVRRGAFAEGRSVGPVKPPEVIRPEPPAV